MRWFFHVTAEPTRTPVGVGGTVTGVTGIPSGRFPPAMTQPPTDRVPIEQITLSLCIRCGEVSLWYMGNLIFPPESTAPLPTVGMPEDVKADYQEAASILSASPRAAAALLRLAIQKLFVHLGETGRKIDDDIASLVRKGLPDHFIKALDVVRVIGNNAVHPGEIQLEEQPDLVQKMFPLVNYIVDRLITEPQTIAELYGGLPQGAKDAAERRNERAKL